MSHGNAPPTLIRVVAVAALLHVAVALFFVGTSIVAFRGLSSRQVSEDWIATFCEGGESSEPGASVEECKRTMTVAQMKDVLSSSALRYWFALFMSFGLVFNAVLAFAAWELLGRRVAAGVRRLTVLMMIVAVYFHGTPMLLVGRLDVSAAMAFGGAWGIGNMGLVCVMLTRFWLWGPALAIFATRNDWVWRSERRLTSL